MHQQISSGTLDAPSWRLIRIAKLAASMYAPLGTTMSLGDYVRVVRTFLDAFKIAEAPRTETSSDGEAPPPEQVAREDMKIVQLGRDLKVCRHTINYPTRYVDSMLQEYQEQLSRWGIKDDRVRRPLPRPAILYRICLRAAWSFILLTISLPGLLLWLPVFIFFSQLVTLYLRQCDFLDLDSVVHFPEFGDNVLKLALAVVNVERVASPCRECCLARKGCKPHPAEAMRLDIRREK